METDETTKASTPSRGRRWALRLVKAFRFLVVLAIGLLVLYTIADQITWRRVVAQRAEFAQRFNVVNADTAIPTMPLAGEDAGRYYRYAWSLIARENDVENEVDPFTAMHNLDDFANTLDAGQTPTAQAAADYARRKLMTAQPGLDVALEAAQMKRGVLSPTNDAALALSSFAEARSLARYLSAAAEVSAIDGDGDRALEYVHATLHLAGMGSENRTLLSQLVQIAIVGIAFDTSQRVLGETDPSPERIVAVMEQTRTLRDPENFVQALSGEYLHTRDRLYEMLPRLWAGLNELKMTEVLMSMSDAVRAESPDHQRELLAQADNTASDGISIVYALAQITAPALIHSVDTWNRMEAHTTLLQVGLAISQYHREHGEYPEKLELVAPYLNEGVPSDPYTGNQLVYERRGAGYVLYSLGPNLTDDGGVALAGPGGMKGDVTWAIDLPEQEPHKEDAPAGRSRRSTIP